MRSKYGIEFDFLIFSCLMLLSCIIIFTVGYLMQRNERFNTMQYLVSTVGSTAMVYDVQTGMAENNSIYLSKFVDGGIMKMPINPFDTTGYCDVDKSYVYKKKDIYYVTLKCGDYNVKDYAYHNSDKMTIYKENSLGEVPIKILNVKGE
jgi:hypothetical protein